MASIFARDLAGLTSAEIAKQQADTQQRAVDLAYLAQIANASVQRAGDVGRERVGMRTTDNSRDVGMRNADVTDRGLTLRRDSDVDQNGVNIYRIESENERARQSNLTQLEALIRQAELQQAANAAANAQRNEEIRLRSQGEQEAARIRASANSDAGTIDPKLLDMLMLMEDQKRTDAMTAAEMEGADIVEKNQPGTARSMLGWLWGIQDYNDSHADMVRAAIEKMPGGTNRFSVAMSPNGKPVVKPKPLPPTDMNSILERARRPSAPGMASTQAPVAGAPAPGLDLRQIQEYLSRSNPASGTTNAPAVANQPSAVVAPQAPISRPPLGVSNAPSPYGSGQTNYRLNAMDALNRAAENYRASQPVAPRFDPDLTNDLVSRLINSPAPTNAPRAVVPQPETVGPSDNFTRDVSGNIVVWRNGVQKVVRPNNADLQKALRLGWSTSNNNR